MKSFVPTCCTISSGAAFVLCAGLVVATVPAYAEKGTVSQKSNHHTHHHGKSDSHTKHAKPTKVASGHKSEKVSKHKHPHSEVHKKHSAAAGASHGVSKQPVAKEAPPPQPQAAPSIPALDNKGTETGLPLPRFAALRADRVYMRRGPGERYPIDWVYHRRGYPVKIEREFGVWRLVEDPDGQKGWVHQVTLRGGRSFVIPGTPSSNGTKLPTAQHADPRIVAYMPEQDLLRSQNHDIPLMSSQETNRKIVAMLEPGTVGAIKACPQGSSWCHVTVKGYDGWLERQSLWGIEPNEIIQPD